MKRFALVFIYLFLAVSQASAETKASSTEALETPRLSGPLFVVETDEESATDSLNRISGQIDKGFIYSDEDSSYNSDSHYRMSPFARQDQQDRI